MKIDPDLMQRALFSRIAYLERIEVEYRDFLLAVTRILNPGDTNEPLPPAEVLEQLLRVGIGRVSNV